MTQQFGVVREARGGRVPRHTVTIQRATGPGPTPLLEITYRTEEEAARAESAIRAAIQGAVEMMGRNF